MEKFVSTVHLYDMMKRKYQDIVHFGVQVLTAVFDRTWKIRIRHMGLS